LPRGIQGIEFRGQRQRTGGNLGQLLTDKLQLPQLNNWAGNRLTSRDLTHEVGGTAKDFTYSYPRYNPASQLLIQSLDNTGYAFPDWVASATSYSVNGLNQYTQVGGVAASHDNNGNLRSDGCDPQKSERH
jgi:hypothetical protein